MSDVLEQMMREINRLNRQIEAFQSGGYATLQFVPLTTPLTSTSWDGDSFSDVTTSTQLDLSAVFGTPAGIKAVVLKVKALDSAAWGTAGLYFACGPSDAQWAHFLVAPKGGDVEERATSPVTCDANGDIWYRINASGSGTMDITLAVVGYWI